MNTLSFIKDKNNNNYLVIDRNNLLVLFKDDKNYCVTPESNMKGNKIIDINKVSSFSTLMPAVGLFEKYSLPLKEQLESLAKTFNEVDNKTLVFSILEHEESWSTEINNVDIKVLENIYDDFIDNDGINLLSDEIKELENKYSYKTLENEVIDKLKENGINPNLIPNDKLENIYDDILEEAINEDTDVETIIEFSDYLDGTIEELQKEQENGEEDEL